MKTKVVRFEDLDDRKTGQQATLIIVDDIEPAPPKPQEKPTIK